MFSLFLCYLYTVLYITVCVTVLNDLNMFGWLYGYIGFVRCHNRSLLYFSFTVLYCVLCTVQRIYEQILKSVMVSEWYQNAIYEKQHQITEIKTFLCSRLLKCSVFKIQIYADKSWNQESEKVHRLLIQKSEQVPVHNSLLESRFRKRTPDAEKAPRSPESSLSFL